MYSHFVGGGWKVIDEWRCTNCTWVCKLEESSPWFAIDMKVSDTAKEKYREHAKFLPDEFRVGNLSY